MAVQLQVRNRYGMLVRGVNEWVCDGETNRNEPTKFMKETARDYRRERPDYDSTPLYADDPPSDNRFVHGATIQAVKLEIDYWYEEQE